MADTSITQKPFYTSQDVDLDVYLNEMQSEVNKVNINFDKLWVLIC